MTERPKNPNHTLLEETNLGGGNPPPSKTETGRGLRVSKGKSLARHSEESLARHSVFTKNASRFNFVSPQGETEGEMRRSRTDK